MLTSTFVEVTTVVILLVVVLFLALFGVDPHLSSLMSLEVGKHKAILEVLQA